MLECASRRLAIHLNSGLSTECVSSSRCQKAECERTRTNDRRSLLPLPADAPRDAQGETLSYRTSSKGANGQWRVANGAATRRYSPFATPYSPDPTGGARRDRTDDLMLAKHALSQLSYGPVNLVGLGGLEPPTSRLSSARSNQLSYKPGAVKPVDSDQ